MTIELINQTDYANIYGLYTDAGKPIGTKEVRLAGRDCGTYYYSWGTFSRAQVKAMFAQTENAARTAGTVQTA